MELFKAEEVPGMRFRGRRVFLEQYSDTKEQQSADLPKVKRECVEFALGIKAMQEKQGSNNGTIIVPSKVLASRVLN